MAIIENLLSRFGYTKLDPRRRDLLARAEAASGLGPGLLPPALAVAEIVPMVPLAPPRAARGSTPPPIPASGPGPQREASIEPAGPAVADPTPARETDEEAAESSEQEWEWRLALARARGREDDAAATAAADRSAADATLEVPRRLAPACPRPLASHAAESARARHRGPGRRSAVTPSREPAKVRPPGAAIAQDSLRKGWQ